MEVKKHHYAAPVALAISALLALSVVAVNHLTTRQYTAVRALTTRVINAQPTGNGLVKISIRRPPTIQVSTGWTQAGSTTSMQLSLQ